jgi:putative endonuclease
MYFVYILKSLSTGIYYKGLTNNLEKRLMQHFSGQVLSTKNILPLVLIHIELCNSRKEAREMEKFFKSGYGREVIKEITENKV